ncbi:hypothetical protein [Finegoldia magna]|uniref:hypothetical protein n=1 Tax=Finegoldia magna TaxID=1260 RepID=UPI000B91C547|nr:hypothetical protein [Finegoldia magna]OXZ39975.1 hypothetical protein B9N50_00020 [Finegoldia magna]
MGVFTNSLKTFKSDITGKTKTYKVNNAVWLYLEADYGLKQGDWVNMLEKDEVLTLGKFATSILKANKIDTTLEEVLENTDIEILNEFVNAYGTLALNLDTEEDVEEKNA